MCIRDRSKAAGLFVDPPKGPVLLNYGIDECRFTKPVYPGMTIGVRFTAKEKITQEKKDEKIVKVAFPENYGNKELSGKEAEFKCKIKEISSSVDSDLLILYWQFTIKTLGEFPS